MGRLFLVNLDGRIYSCKHCQAHLAHCDDIVSKVEYCYSPKRNVERRLNRGPICLVRLIKAFHCRHGKAYLFRKVVNVMMGLKEERMMMTGMHTVSDIFCVGCGSIVGWKYEAASERNQKYKEGKFILERYMVSGPDGSPYLANLESHAGGSDAEDA